MAVADSLPLDPHRLRSDFPILWTTVHGSKPLIYLDNAASTQHPREVIDAIVEAYQSQYANVHRGSHWLSDTSTSLYENARTAVAGLINASESCEVIFTSGTTGGINLVARSWGDANVTSHDEILLSVMEHHSNIVPWQQLAERTRCRLRYLPITDDGRLELGELEELLTERTKLVSICAVSNVLGTINPLEEIVKRARQVGAKILVDAAQAVPHQAVDVQQWDVDFAVFSGHKMLGPSGVGCLFGRKQLLEEMPPFLGGGSMIRSVTLEGFEPAELPAKFEAGTPPIVPATGMVAAINYLGRVDLSAIDEYERILLRRAHDLLDEIEGLRRLGPDDVRQKAGIVSFAIDGIHPYDIAQYLDTQGVAIRAGHLCAMPLHQRYGLSHSCRASFYFYNTLDEIDAFVEALQKARKLFLRQAM